MRRTENPSTPHALPTPEQQICFDVLATRFEQKIKDEGQVTHIMSGEPYKSLVSMGQAAIQPILTRMSEGTTLGNTLWFMPLRAIVESSTRKAIVLPKEKYTYDPKVPYSQFEGDRKAWLRWGAKNGYEVRLSEE